MEEKNFTLYTFISSLSGIDTEAMFFINDKEGNRIMEIDFRYALNISENLLEKHVLNWSIVSNPRENKKASLGIFIQIDEGW